MAFGQAAQYRKLSKSPEILGNDLKYTPGSIRTKDAKDICGRTTKALRHVTELDKITVFQAYGIPLKNRSLYEVDHLISLEIGGENGIKNLWPQPYSVPGAHQKDILENKLHKMICESQITPAKAQRMISRDWYSAYKIYVKRSDGKLGR